MKISLALLLWLGTTSVVYAEAPVPVEKPIEASSEILTESELSIVRTFVAPTLPFTDTTNQYANNRAAKKLGQQLFFEPRLSSNGKVSCATCHDFSQSLADGKALAVGLSTGGRNTPTLINAGMQRWFFHDGRADSLWLQALGPIESKLEMGGNWQKIHRVFVKDSTLLTAYNQVFSATPLLPNVPYFKIDKNRFKVNVGKALAAYEMDLVQFNSRFDDFVTAVVNGNDHRNELTLSEQRGLKVFMGKGRCVQCHSGANFSDGEFHNIRLMAAVNNPQDSGRYGAINGLKENPLNTLGVYSDDSTAVKTLYIRQYEAQWAAFKTPTLRNIALTAPYMHDGSMATLRDVIEHYSRFERAAPDHHKNPLLTPLNFTEQEMSDLEAFLKSLSGTVLNPSY